MVFVVVVVLLFITLQLFLKLRQVDLMSVDVLNVMHVIVKHSDTERQWSI